MVSNKSLKELPHGLSTQIPQTNFKDGLKKLSRKLISENGPKEKYRKTVSTNEWSQQMVSKTSFDKWSQIVASKHSVNKMLSTNALHKWSQTSLDAVV